MSLSVDACFSLPVRSAKRISPAVVQSAPSLILRAIEVETMVISSFAIAEEDERR
jgi:hypothetical protein